MCEKKVPPLSHEEAALQDLRRLEYKVRGRIAREVQEEWREKEIALQEAKQREMERRTKQVMQTALDLTTRDLMSRY